MSKFETSVSIQCHRYSDNLVVEINCSSCGDSGDEGSWRAAHISAVYSLLCDIAHATPVESVREALLEVVDKLQG